MKGRETYLRANPQPRRCNAKAWRSEERRVREVEGEEDQVPQKVLAMISGYDEH